MKVCLTNMYILLWFFEISSSGEEELRIGLALEYVGGSITSNVTKKKVHTCIIQMHYLSIY